MRKMQKIKQSINITRAAYLWMLDDKSWADAKIKSSQWKAMSNKLRVEAHLRNITEQLGGEGFSYNILED